MAAAVELLGGGPRRLELARALVAFGAALRRGGRRVDAQGVLRRGMDLAERCGARPLAELAREELTILGLRPRRLAVSGADALTPAERRVAELAADGLTNPQIAQSLFVSRKTVESHLARVFDKLGVRSRHDLPAALGKTSGSAP